MTRFWGVRVRTDSEDTKSGARQYFTTRALIQAMVACMRLESMKTIAQSPHGTEEFILGAYKRLARSGKKLNLRQMEFLHREDDRLHSLVYLLPPMYCSRKSSIIWKPRWRRFAT
jgi:hypothetical protein